MITQELLVYIRGELAKGRTREEIHHSLVSSGGWTEDDLNEAFKTFMPFSVATPVSTSPIVSSNVTDVIQPQIKSPEINHSKGKKIFYVILVLIFLGLAGGGAYAYYSGVFVSLPKLVSGAVDSARSSTSANYDATINVDFSEVKSAVSSIGQLFPGGGSLDKITFTIKGAYDVTDAKNMKSATSISAVLGALSFAAEFRALGGTFYGVLTKAPTIGFIPMLTEYQNKWFSFPYKSNDSQVAKSLISTIFGIDSSVIDKVTPEQKDHLYKMVRDAHFIKAVQRFSPETVGGELSYHFTFNLDRGGITTYLTSLKEYVNSIGKNDSALSAFDPTSFEKELDGLKDFKGEIWIGRNDKLLHKFVLNFGIQPDIAKSEQVKVSVVGIFSRWNQSVSIVAPAESIPFADLITSLMTPTPVVKGTEIPVKKK